LRSHIEGAFRATAPGAATIRKRAPNPVDHLALASRYHDEGKLDRAIISYRRALALDDARAETYNDLGLAYFAKGFLDDAAKNLRESIARDPNHHIAYANLGAVLRRQGRLQEARRAYQAALRIRVRDWLRRAVLFLAPR
jgi:tetratricopeptide (TPR) repeat protein